MIKAISQSWPFNPAITRVLAVFGFAFATAVGAHIKIPVPGTFVPMTMQTAIVLLAGLKLGSRDGAISQALYVVGGVLGLPFFASSFGFAVLFGPTGGYLIGFILAALLLGYLKPFTKSFFSTWIIVFLGSVAVFVPGIIQLKFTSGVNWMAALQLGLYPFIIGDLLKVTLVSATDRVTRIQKA